MEKTFDILTEPLNWSLNHVIYSFKCKQCHFCFPYSGSTTAKFTFKMNNCKITHRKFRKKHVDKDLAIVIKKLS